MKYKEQMIRMSFRLPKEVKRKIENFGKKNKMNPSEIIRHLIEHYLLDVNK